MICRHCGTPLNQLFIDLGKMPPSNAYVSSENPATEENHYPLKVMVCNNCWLVQTEDFVVNDELFSSDYAYFSSYSASWCEHAKTYVEAMVSRFGFDQSSTIVEIAANDGYLLQYVKEKEIPCYGIEPTASTAEAARKKNIEIIEAFFGLDLARQLVTDNRNADLIVANNVLAHVPDINDFIKGIARLLNPLGIVTFEFPHLLRLVKESQFDTIYHEHYSYLSLIAVNRILKENGIAVFDVEELATHGGSLRIYAQRRDMGQRKVEKSIAAMLDREEAEGMSGPNFYGQLQVRAKTIKGDFVAFLNDAREKDMKVGAYGAAAKGNTLLNFAGIHSDLIQFVVDKNPAKQGKYLPGSRIPIVCEDEIRKQSPDYIVLLPWNLEKEITIQLEYIREWNAKFVVAIPELRVF